MTRNGRSIVLTAVLALILVYLFSIVGYIFFKDDFILAVDRIPNKTLGRQQQQPRKGRRFPLLGSRSNAASDGWQGAKIKNTVRSISCNLCI